MAKINGLFLGIPAYQGIEAECFSSILRLKGELDRLGIGSMTYVAGNCGLLVKVRNDMLASFYHSGASHCLMLDSDITFRAEDVIRLVRADVDFCGIAAPLRRTHWDRVERAAKAGIEPMQASAYQFNVSLLDAKRLGQVTMRIDDRGLIEVPAVATALLMLRRSMVEKMIERYADTEYAMEDGRPAWNLFCPMVRNREFRGEDFAFCLRWTDIGGRIHVLADAPVVHTGAEKFAGNYADNLRAQHALSTGTK